MAEERIRREKCYTLRKIKIDNEVDGLDGPNPKLFQPGTVVMLSNLQYTHYSRAKCVTKDIPEGAE
jgi:hypothetical protein